MVNCVRLLIHDIHNKTATANLDVARVLGTRLRHHKKGTTNETGLHQTHQRVIRAEQQRYIT